METKLWALLVPGPDDLWPMPSHEAATEAATRHNEILESSDWLDPGLRESGRARVVEWPYGADAHAEMIASGESEVLSSNDLGIPDGVAQAVTGKTFAEAEDEFNAEQAKKGGMPYGTFGGYD